MPVEQHIKAVVWVGHVDPERSYNTTAVVIDCEPREALDHEERGAFAGAFDGGVSTPPGVGFWVWEGAYEWYDDRGSLPDGEGGCRMYAQTWRPAGALEVWRAQASAKKGVPDAP